MTSGALGLETDCPVTDYGSLGVNGGGKVDHMGGSIVGLRHPSGTFCRRP